MRDSAFRTPIGVERFIGENAQESEFAPKVTLRGRRTGRSRTETTSDSSEVVSDTLVLFPAKEAVIPAGSRLTLPEGEQNRVCIVETSRLVYKRDNVTVAYQALEIV
ncbi:hypothetical protein CH296_11210 [Rhodococcus sp. 14-2496-1d]|uniref:hypothetical protein n=1 Tax=Rhodococcus sp. 14-2496-1d TaxID=2023146 RepID=UPI000B9BACAF|nr:hypothetical protein [Rhodococcus sp. 14-2496-1d]OZF33196.1 hypothetical protein CH296_11210 [Rhodococcus sp. 14-2496-1d]